MKAKEGLSPSVDDNVNMTWTIGFDHLINLSLPLRNLSKACVCPRITSKMVSGVLQTLKTTAKGDGRAGCLIVVVGPIRMGTSFGLREERAGFVGNPRFHRLHLHARRH